MHIFKLTIAEIKKMLRRPSLYIMSFIVVVAMVASMAIFSTTNSAGGRITVTGASSVNDIYDQFTSTSGIVNSDTYIAMLDSLEDKLDYYRDMANNNSKQEILALYQSGSSSVSFLFDRYYTDLNSNYGAATLQADNTNLINALNALLSRFNSEISPEDSAPLGILIDSDQKNAFSEALNTTLLYLGNIEDFSKIPVQNIINNIVAQEFLSVGGESNIIISAINSIENVTVEYSLIENLQQNYIDIARTRLNDILADMAAFKVEKGDSILQADKSEMNEFVSKYCCTVLTVEQVINNALTSNILKDKLDVDAIKYFSFDGYYSYQVKETYVKYAYLFDNDLMYYDYAKPFSFMVSSNSSATAYDFIYFSLEVVSILIIIFAISMGASMIAGEQSSGTIKLLAIRPYKRWKILTSKLIATLYFIIIFILLSVVCGFIIGNTLYPDTISKPIIMVYNATTASIIQPMPLLGIYCLTLFVKVTFYALIALTISVILTSNAASITISLMFYFISLALSMFLSDTYWYRYVPLNNLDFFKYFGGAFVSDNTQFSSIFSTAMLHDMSFNMSAIIAGCTMLGFVLLTYVIFTNKDIQ